MGAEQLAGDFIREQLGRLIEPVGAVLAAIGELHASPGIGGTLTDRLAKTRPSRSLIRAGVVQHTEQVFAGISEESVAIQYPGLGLQKRVGTETMLVDFGDQLSGAAVGAERRRIRAHAAE